MYSPPHADSETVIRVDEHDARIQMMLYTDHSYTKAFSSTPIIELGDKVGECSTIYESYFGQAIIR